MKNGKITNELLNKTIKEHLSESTILAFKSNFDYLMNGFSNHKKIFFAENKRYTILAFDDGNIKEGILLYEKDTKNIFFNGECQLFEMLFNQHEQIVEELKNDFLSLSVEERTHIQPLINDFDEKINSEYDINFNGDILHSRNLILLYIFKTKFKNEIVNFVNASFCDGNTFDYIESIALDKENTIKNIKEHLEIEILKINN